MNVRSFVKNWFDRTLNVPKVKHSTFCLDSDYKTSTNFGLLTPTQLVEVLPGDVIKTNKHEVYCRLSPLKFPLMHRIKVNTHDFFVPFHQILGPELYEQFLQQKVDWKPLVFRFAIEPELGPTDWRGTVFDYFGLEFGELDADHTDITVVNPAPIISYWLIIRNWFVDEVLNADIIETIDTFIERYRKYMRGEQLMNVIDLSYDNGNWSKLIELFNLAYTRDYFTSAAVEPQRGNEILVNAVPTTFADDYGSNRRLSVDSSSTVKADGGATGYLHPTTTIRELWRAEQLQQFEQINNKYGNRTREFLAGQYGVIADDQSLLIPRYLGGSSSVVQIADVIQTSSTEVDSPLGSYAGKGSAFNRSRSASYLSKYHGYMFSFASLIPDNGYCNGIDKLWTKTTLLDYALPCFNNIGYQSIDNVEVYNGDSYTTEKSGTDWAYQPRYSEYRGAVSRCTGAFRDSALLGFHMDRKFDSLPPFNDEFIKIKPEATERIFNVYVGTDKIFMDVNHSLIISRPISFDPDPMHLY